MPKGRIPSRTSTVELPSILSTPSVYVRIDVFGAPLRQVAVYASTVTVLGGLEHELPIVVYSCVEELYRGKPH